jgi:hypothetical protein
LRYRQEKKQHGGERQASTQNENLKTAAIELDGRAACWEWILRNQLGRRNLTPYMMGILALKLEDAIAARAKARQGTRTDIKPISAECSNPIETREEIAKLAGIGKTQIK